MLDQNPLKILSITLPRKAYSLLAESGNEYIVIVIDSQLVVDGKTDFPFDLLPLLFRPPLTK